MLMAFVPALAQERREEASSLRDTLPAAVKTAFRRMDETLPGTFSTDMRSLRGKVLSPVGENDPLKFAMTRPGVSSGAEGFSAVFARGGNLGSNLFTLDGVRIYGYSHLLGLTTAIPADAVSSMDFRLGGFSGETGGLTASHIALHTPELDAVTWQGAASVSNTFAGASMSIPVVKDHVSVFAAGRWSPFGLEYGLLRRGFDKAGRMPSLSLGVWDGYVKVQADIASGHRLELSGFRSGDDYELGFSGSDYQLGWRNAMGHLRYGFTLRSTTIRVDASYNSFDSRMEHDALIRGESSYVQLRSQVEERSYSLQAEHRLFGEHVVIKEGVRHQRGRMSPGAAKMSETKIVVVEDAPYAESVSHPVLTSGFLELGLHLGPVDMMAALRRNAYKNNTERAWIRYESKDTEFSGSAKWRIMDWLALEATYDSRIQYDHTLEGTPLGWSLDLIVPCTNRLLPETARQVYGGAFLSYGDHALTLGGYHKRMENLVYYTDAMAMFTSASLGWADNAKVGSGTSYGAELLYEGHLEDGPQWSLAYTWSKTDRRFPDIDAGQAFPARYDRRHVLNASGQWKGVSVGFTLQSGHWETVAGGQYLGHLFQDDIVVNYFTHPNNWQMPLYIRLDLGYQLMFMTGSGTRKLEHDVTIGVFNVLNRHNPSMLSYDIATKTWNLVSFFPVMPSLKYTLSF